MKQAALATDAKKRRTKRKEHLQNISVYSIRLHTALGNHNHNRSALLARLKSVFSFNELVASFCNTDEWFCICFSYF